MRVTSSKLITLGLLLSQIILALLLHSDVSAQEDYCAQVRIEIQQELTLERQAFDARMKIQNALTASALTEVQIRLAITDEDGTPIETTSDPSAGTALFFQRLSSIKGISDIDGSGSVASASEAELHWLLIPTAGAAANQPQGKRYLVGATLRYKLAGEQQELSVTPDAITVKPQPLLALDYFLPSEVQADEPSTPAIEAPVPFSLGLRVKNIGVGAAQKLSIESARPKIVENTQQLLIGFEMLSSAIDDQPARSTLLVDFGDLAAGQSKSARWDLQTSLSGTFSEFSARFSHADELGGQLTSLLSRVSTHLLLGNVRVELPGRDAVRDFLARDAGLLKVYESQGLDSLVTDYTGTANLGFVAQSGETSQYQLELPPTAGLFYYSANDPFGGAKGVARVRRSDGKQLAAENAWLSSEGTGAERRFVFHLFDANAGGRYLIDFGPAPASLQLPQLQFIADRSAAEGERVSFVVQGSRPAGGVPRLSLDALPLGASFSDRGDGSGVFDWQLAPGQLGKFRLTFRAQAPEGVALRSALLTVFSALDRDLDGMRDSWELFFFGNTDRDGSGDFDRDGTLDSEEHDRGTDPTYAGVAPKLPQLLTPADGAQVSSARPTLVLKNSEHGKIPPIYQIELYRDQDLTQPVASILDLSETEATTAWAVPLDLTENTRYFLRARAGVEGAFSEWLRASFFVNQQNDPPSALLINSPSDGSVLAERQPVLSVSSSSDPEGQALQYSFELRRDSPQGALLASAEGLPAQDSAFQSWSPALRLEQEDLQYFWRALARDPQGAERASAWARFVVSFDNAAPAAPELVSPLAGSVYGSALPAAPVNDASVRLVARASKDPEHDALRYRCELDLQPAFDSGQSLRIDQLEESQGLVTCSFSGLREDQRYYWRIQASDGLRESAWSLSNFIFSTLNAAPSTPVIDNPGAGAWIEVLQPSLRVAAARDPEQQAVWYHFKLFADAGRQQLLAEELSQEHSWKLPFNLSDNQAYYWQVRAQDAEGAASEWSALHTFFINQDGKNDAPWLTLTAPSTLQHQVGSVLRLQWSDHDPDSNALISIFANAELLVSGIEEDADGEADGWLWDTNGLPAGSYRIKARISDGQSQAEAALEQLIVLEAPGNSTDFDRDGVSNEADNCPYLANPDQRDSGGLWGRAKRDAIGDACQCGDLDGDGTISAKDAQLVRRSARKQKPLLLDAAQKLRCNLSAKPGCALRDAKLIEKYLAKKAQLLKKKAKPAQRKKLILPQQCDAARAGL
jgi:hypothetical protein